MVERNSAERELLLTQYRELRQEIRNAIDSAKDQLLKGITAIGFIAAYAGYTGHYSLFLFVPVVVLALLSEYFHSIHWMYKTSYQVAKIELELNTLGFDWERQVMLEGSNTSSPCIQKLSDGSMYGFYGLIVIVITVFSINVAFHEGPTIDLFGVTVGIGTVLGLYTLLFILCGLIFYASEKERRERRRDIAREQRDKVISSSKQYLHEQGSAHREDFRTSVFPPYSQLYDFSDWWEIVSGAIAEDDDFRLAGQYCYHRSEEHQRSTE